MPTQNPRITVTLTPEVAAVLQAMSEETGSSQSAIVGELLAVSMPVFERVVQAARAARVMQESARSEIAAGLGRAQERLEAQIPLHLATIDEGFRPLLEHAEQVKRRAGRTHATGTLAAPARARGSAVEVGVPPISNKGGKVGRRGARK